MNALGPVREIVVHHTASPRETTVEQIREWHTRDRGWADIGYHLVVLGDASVAEGRPLGFLGAHAPPNAGRIGVAATGDNTVPGREWTTAQRAKLREVIEALLVIYPSARVVGHAAVTAPGHTVCPGIEVASLLRDAESKENSVNVLKRIAGSKKTAIALLAILGDLGAVVGFDVPREALTEGLGLIWNGLAGLLITAQAAIDTVHGSPSDRKAD